MSLRRSKKTGALKVNRHVISWFVADGMNLLAQSLLVVTKEAGP